MSTATASPNGAAEMPSGKDAAYENFPVGSFLIPAALRPHVMRFYDFARAIDDVADSPALSADEKVHRLSGFEAAVTDSKFDDPDYIKGIRMRISLEQTGVTARHCQDLVAAFKQDSVKNRYSDWADLRAYCRLSASPVGRYLIDLHGGVSEAEGTEADYAQSDALCEALQVINHLQDCADDYRTLNRIYLPGDWMADAGMKISDLDKPFAGSATRRVLDQCVAGIEELLQDARALPGRIVHPSLSLEAAVIVEIAERLTAMLSRQDPLAERVALSKIAYGTVFIRVILRRKRAQLDRFLAPSEIGYDGRGSGSGTIAGSSQ